MLADKKRPGKEQTGRSGETKNRFGKRGKNWRQHQARRFFHFVRQKRLRYFAGMPGEN